MLPFASCHMKDNVKAIQFYIKSRGMEGLVFVKKTLEKCITNLYFQNSKVVTTKVSLYNKQWSYFQK